MAASMRVLAAALRRRRCAHNRFGWRLLCYALQLGDEVWVVHAFQKKSKSGITTPKAEIDLINERIKRLKEVLR
jgi:phage-related protein